MTPDSTTVLDTRHAAPPAAFAAKSLWLRGLLLAPAIVLSAAWGGLALWYRLPLAPTFKGAIVAAFVLTALSALAASAGVGRLGKPAWWLYLLALAGVLLWWSTLRPSQDRAWADDVSRQLHAQVDGDRVRLDNVRNFDWRSDSDYTPRWERRDYDLSRLESADLVLSYWMGPAIAHTLVSFGFDDGRKLVFSVEIRKERGEAFSTVGGFFREFETALVAADERDILRVRSNVRNEDVYLYRLRLPKAALRSLFLGYLAQARELERQPSFYNTLTSNCTTIVFDLMRQIAPGLPLDYRLLLSGYLAEYAYDQGGLMPGYDYRSLHERGRVTDRARAAGDSAAFSELIREGVPGAASEPARAR
ncbi:Lnb N-terminal periplasmic domain-containing protein [Lysobacter sp. 1R34A]|uniref:Lnb N-terminal periplasmic domain-containing protein n=1 Tax=Lysobacter sp. 1R34A TaxID=3445786 RepID=UPI003EE8B1E9